MNQKVEIERMEAAFKRAAEKATRGTREERSGRFEVRDDSRLTRGDAQTDKPRRGSNLKKWDWIAARTVGKGNFGVIEDGSAAMSSGR